MGVIIVSDDKSNSKFYGLVGGLIFVAIIVVWFGVGHWPGGYQLPGHTFEAAEAGQFGDSFGYINSLFSALAFGGVILTILMQSHELRLQREELRLQREEMRLQRKEMEDTREELKGQKRALQITTRVQAIGSITQAYATLTADENSRNENRYSTYLSKFNEMKKDFRYDRDFGQARRDLESTSQFQLNQCLTRLRELEDDAKELLGMGKSGEEDLGD